MDSKDNPEKIYPSGYEPKETNTDANVRNQLLNEILKSSPTEFINTDLFTVMSKRRSTRKFADKIVETVKIDKIIAAADTAPTAGNFQGFEIFYVKSPEKKQQLVEACNNQPYVHAPVASCMANFLSISSGKFNLTLDGFLQKTSTTGACTYG